MKTELKQCKKCKCMKNIKTNSLICKRCEDKKKSNFEKTLENGGELMIGEIE